MCRTYAPDERERKRERNNMDRPSTIKYETSIVPIVRLVTMFMPMWRMETCVKGAVRIL